MVVWQSANKLGHSLNNAPPYVLSKPLMKLKLNKLKNKLPLLFLYTVLFFNVVNAQTIDKCVLKCVYKISFQQDSTSKLTSGTDIMVLEIGMKTSLFYSELSQKGDSLMAIDEKTGNTFSTPEVSDKYNLDSWTIVIAKNYPANKVTVAERIVTDYRYSEALLPQQWVIARDTATLLGMLCNKATTYFRGRHYEAWFTKTIPTVHGPWKFYGLPGLIVKVCDSQNQFSFELVTINKLKGIEMIIPTKNYVRITRKGLSDLKAQFHEDPITFMENNSPYHMKFNESPLERKQRKEPYNPIELF